MRWQSINAVPISLSKCTKLAQPIPKKSNLGEPQAPSCHQGAHFATGANHLRKLDCTLQASSKPSRYLNIWLSHDIALLLIDGYLLGRMLLLIISISKIIQNDSPGIIDRMTGQL